MSKVGDVKIITQEYCQRECENCGQPATKRLSFLYENARHNPASSAYGNYHGNIGWCSDAETFCCDEPDCYSYLRSNPPSGTEWGSTFPGFKDGEPGPLHHMVCHWVTINTELTEADND